MGQHDDAQVVFLYFLSLLRHYSRKVHKLYWRLIVLRCLLGSFHSTAPEKITLVVGIYQCLSALEKLIVLELPGH